MDTFRVDFAYRDPEDNNAIKALVEVKSVCLADYNPETRPKRAGAVFVNPISPYQRHGTYRLNSSCGTGLIVYLSLYDSSLSLWTL